MLIRIAEDFVIDDGDISIIREFPDVTGAYCIVYRKNVEKYAHTFYGTLTELMDKIDEAKKRAVGEIDYSEIVNKPRPLNLDPVEHD